MSFAATRSRFPVPVRTNAPDPSVTLPEPPAMTSSGFALEKSAPETNRIEEEAWVIKIGCATPASVAVSKPSLIVFESEMSPAARRVRSAGAPLKRQFAPVAVRADLDPRLNQQGGTQVRSQPGRNRRPRKRHVVGNRLPHLVEIRAGRRRRAGERRGIEGQHGLDDDLS